MTKKDLAKLYVEKGYCTSVAGACKQIENFIDVIHDALLTGDKVSMHNFLSMKVVETPQRTFKNPKTGEESVLEASKRIKITQTPGFRKIVGD